MATETRQRMIETAARLFQRDGYHATSWRGLVDAAGTPWGSVHHHFPGGKEELGAAAIDAGSGAVAALIEHCFQSEPDPVDAVGRWFTLSAGLLSTTGFVAGCPVATVALETAPHSDALGAASRRAFDQWEGLIAAQLRRAGASRAKASSAATVVLTLFEGGLLLARVRGDDQPMSLASRQAQAVVAGALGATSAPSGSRRRGG
jgi:TetR/AcrR family transcriptional repressor of lmrAB and yxaGH operons